MKKSLLRSKSRRANTSRIKDTGSRRLSRVRRKRIESYRRRQGKIISINTTGTVSRKLLKVNTELRELRSNWSCSLRSEESMSMLTPTRKQKGSSRRSLLTRERKSDRK